MLWPDTVDRIKNRRRPKIQSNSHYILDEEHCGANVDLIYIVCSITIGDIILTQMGYTSAVRKRIHIEIKTRFNLIHEKEWTGDTIYNI